MCSAARRSSSKRPTSRVKAPRNAATIFPACSTAIRRLPPVRFDACARSGLPGPKINPILRHYLPGVPSTMASPYPMAAVLGSLVFVMRHERGAPDHQQSLVRMFRTILPRGELVIEAAPNGRRLSGEVIPLDAPGASLVCEQLLLHEIQSAVIPADISDPDLLRFAATISAFPGTY